MKEEGRTRKGTGSEPVHEVTGSPDIQVFFILATLGKWQMATNFRKNAEFLQMGDLQSLL